MPIKKAALKMCTAGLDTLYIWKSSCKAQMTKKLAICISGLFQNSGRITENRIKNKPGNSIMSLCIRFSITNRLIKTASMNNIKTCTIGRKGPNWSPWVSCNLNPNMAGMIWSINA